VLTPGPGTQDWCGQPPVTPARLNAAAIPAWDAAPVMTSARARAIAERLHRGQRGTDGEPVIHHVRRVASAVPEEMRAVAWLHEVFEWTPISEEMLLIEGLSLEELRALRLLTRSGLSRSHASYLGHIERIAQANGRAGTIARRVKLADLHDRLGHSRTRADGWSPPYAEGLARLRPGRARP
jgi:predicted DNA-binding protein (UPF0251 family)